MSIDVSEPFRIGRVISRAWGLFQARPALFLGLTAAFVLGPQAAAGAITLAVPGLPASVMNLVLAVVGLIGKLAMLYAALQMLAGRRIAAGDAVSKGMGFFWGAFGIGIVSNLGIAIGLILLLVPGFFLMTIWAVALPSYVARDNGVGAALTNSAKLTKGSRWPVFGLMLITGVAYFGLIAVLVGIAAAAPSADWLIEVILLPLLVATLEVATCVGLPSMYHELKYRGGGTTDQTAEVFA